MRKINKTLATNEINNLNIDNPLNQYPRMQFQRDSYFSLNGLWDYAVSKDKNNRQYQGKILVPYCIESLNSGVQKSLKMSEKIIYHREFEIEKDFLNDITILNILGIDEEFELIINGAKYQKTTSICLPIKIDISAHIKEGLNDIIIIVEDKIKKELPQGKQVHNPKGMFYTSVSGIYYPIFIESYANEHIENLKITPTLSSVNFKVSTESEYTLKIFDNNNEIFSSTTNENNINVEINNPHPWTLNDPFLYQVKISTKKDIIKSYFGLRTIEVKNKKVYLNNEEIFLNGVLDQGYYPEGIYTVSTYDSYKKDILTMKELGFNLLRKHIKIEIDYFYYLCDKYGMLVMQDFVNVGEFNFFYNAVLPNLGFQKLNDKKIKNKNANTNFLIHSLETQKYLYNHPSVIGYTIFNEGWGQCRADEIYTLLKCNDNTHFYDATSGWFRQKLSDFESRHIYFKNISKSISKEKDIIFLTEFGGYSYKIKENSFNLKNNYGYKFFKKQKDFEKSFLDLYQEIINNKNKLTGAIYTQLSDVEDETNGLLTYDRKILKVNKNNVIETMDKLNSK